jgi:hypothetical protein
MSHDRSIEEAVQKLSGTYLKDIVTIIQCTVNSYDTNALTCDCTPLSDNAITDIPGVQLSAEVSDGFVVFPSVGSTVYVALTTRNTAFVLIYSELDSVLFSIPNGTSGTWTKLLIQASGTIPGIVMNDGSYGGLVIGAGNSGNNLITQLGNNNAYITALYTASLQLATVLDGLVPGTLAAFNATMAGQILGNYSNILNRLITQGK